MKKAIILLTGLFIIVAGCKKDFLDRAPSDRVGADQVFSKIEDAEDFLNIAYQALPYFMADPYNKILWSVSDGTDECMQINQSQMRDFNHGKITPQNCAFNPRYLRLYEEIRRVNIFLAHYNMIPEEIGTSGDEIDRKKRLKGEAYGLRAFFYFELFKGWGPVALVKHPLNPGNPDINKLKRSPVSDVLAYVLENVDSAASILPASYSSDALYGRVTATAAKFIASRATLFYASPLFNPNNDVDRWKVAANKAKEALDYAEAHGYQLSTIATSKYGPYARIFQDTKNPEVIFHRFGPNNRNYTWQLDKLTDAVGYGGDDGTEILQELVDDYETTDGVIPVLGYDAADKQIVNPEAIHYDPQDPYVNRDPRFYATVNYPGRVWKGRKIDMTKNGKDVKMYIYNFSPHYLIRKFLNEDENLKTYAGRRYRPWVLFRLSELYLNYAEALNEWQGPVDEVYRLVDTIRGRVHMPHLPAGLTKDQMRERIHHERRIEFALEGQRFWDVRRWKIADKVGNGDVHGVFPDKDGTLHYKTIRTRTFDPGKNYLLPIPQTEMDKNPNFVQNPGY